MSDDERSYNLDLNKDAKLNGGNNMNNSQSEEEQQQQERSEELLEEQKLINLKAKNNNAEILKELKELENKEENILNLDESITDIEKNYNKEKSKDHNYINANPNFYANTEGSNNYKNFQKKGTNVHVLNKHNFNKTELIEEEIIIESSELTNSLNNIINNDINNKGFNHLPKSIISNIPESKN